MRPAIALALGGQAAQPSRDMSDLVLGGYTALAESAWMGAAQASDVLESLASTATLETLLLGMALLAKLRRRIRVFDYNSDTN